MASLRSSDRRVGYFEVQRSSMLQTEGFQINKRTGESVEKRDGVGITSESVCSSCPQHYTILLAAESSYC